MARVFNIKLAAPLSASGSDRIAFFSALRAAGGLVAGEGRLIPWVSVFAENPERLAQIPGVVAIEEDSGCDQCAPIESKSDRTDPWHLRMIEADLAWSKSRGAGAKIAVIDTGVVNHPDLRGAHIASRESFVPMEGPNDRNGHGLSTHGIIAGQGPIVFGVAPEAELHSLKALDRAGRGRWAWIALAVERAAELKCDVAVMALGGPDQSHMLEDALALFASQGGVAVCAAGNDGRSVLDYPGSSASVLTIAAVDRRGRRPKWSSWAPWPRGPDVSAPGVDVPTLSMTGYKQLSGTSIATAIAGGMLALTKLPRALNEARAMVHAATVPLPVSRDQGGYGLLDAAALAGG